MISFREKVLAIVADIPEGKVLTYGEVATAAGNARASRAVGSILSTNYRPDIPCHRVVKKDGGIGGYNRGQSKKRSILLRETGRRFA